MWGVEMYFLFRKKSLQKLPCQVEKKYWYKPQKGENILRQDWVAFVSQPYWVEVMVEVDIEAEVEVRLR